jgi:hypothetical protein
MRFLANLLLLVGITSCGFQEATRSLSNFPGLNSHAMFIDTEMVSNQSSGHTIRWKLKSQDEKLTFAIFQVLDSNSNEVFKKTYSAAELVPSTILSTHIQVDLAEGAYSVRVTTHDEYANEGFVELPLLIDQTAPVIDLLLGGSKCGVSVGEPSDVATRLLPFDSCYQDPGKAASGVTHLCIKKSAMAPALGDSCWKSPSSLVPLFLLSNGANSLKAWAKDRAGNISLVNNNAINLNISEPPVTKAISPTPQTFSQNVWLTGDQKTIVWSATDDDTAFEQLKFIVTLAEVNNLSNFSTLACNFKNTPVWKQCPDTAVELSSLLTTDSATKRISFKFTVPSNWQTTKKYMILLTTIDRSGNASVTSTQEINAGFEVLAGKTYRGIGGSPNRLARTAHSSRTQFDRHGSIYDTVQGFKASAFDLRTCRAFKAPGAAAQFSDCEDIIETAYSVVSSNPWAYDRTADVFYAVTKELSALVKIDFQNHTITPINHIPKKLFAHLSFQEETGTLYFRDEAQLFSLDRAGIVRHVAGAKNGALVPSNQTIAQKNVVLPDADLAFVVTRDNRIYFSGDKLASTPYGSNFGLHYILSGFDPSDSNKLVRLEMLTPDGGVYGAHTLGFTDFALSSLVQDPETNRLYAAGTYHGIAYLDLPATGAAPADYRWKWLVEYSKLGANEKSLILTGIDSAVGVKANFYAFDLLVPATGVLYFNNSLTANALSYDFASKQVERILGGPIGEDGTGFGPNRELESPLSINVKSSNEIWFNDFYNLQKVVLNPTEGSTVSTVQSGFTLHPFRFDLSSNRLVQQAGRTTKVFDLNDMSKAPAVRSMTNQPYNGDVQLGLSNSFSGLKVGYVTSDFDLITNSIVNSYFGMTEIGNSSALPMSSSATVTNAISIENAFNNIHKQLHNRGHISQIAFDAADENMMLCLKEKFVVYNIPNKQLTVFTSKLPNGTVINCMTDSYASRKNLFRFQNNAIYYTNGISFYKLATTTSQIHATANAEWRPVTLQGMTPGLLQDFAVDSGHVYYTDRSTHRVIRTRILAE